ncbi:rhodanese-like domain-containing protein [Methylomonas sp. MgM2]
MKYFPTLFLSCFVFSGALLATELQTVTPEQLLEMQQTRNALVVDVRTEAEWQASGIISNSYKLQSFDRQGKFDDEKWLAALEQMKSSPDQAVILVCRSGNRSAKVGTFLTQQLDMKNVYHLENGLQSWIESGHPVSPNCMKVACK